MPNQTKRQCTGNGETIQHLDTWYPQVCPKGSCIHSAQFHLYPLHPERVPEAGKPDLVWSSRISYSSGHFQIIFPYPPGKKCLGYFQSKLEKIFMSVTAACHNCLATSPLGIETNVS